MNRQPPLTGAQRGVATLIVVMVLFFIATMVAAYASRNIVFEQRTGANYQRATSAQEVAEAGLQWTLAQLNGGRIDSACAPSSSGSDNSFRDRFLDIDGATGEIRPRTFAPTPSSTAPLSPSCVFNGDSRVWACSCPQSSSPTLTTPTAVRASPAFRVVFSRSDSGPSGSLGAGLVTAEITACTRLSAACLAENSGGVANEGRARLRALLYLGSMSTPVPLAALTARGSVTATGLTVSNARFGGSGITVLASGSVGPDVVLNTLAGNLSRGASTTIQGDPVLSSLSDVPGTQPVSARERFFAVVFNALPKAIRDQPAMLRLGNCDGGCNELDVAGAVTANPGRPIWVEGDLVLDTGVSIGTETEPVVLVVDGGNLSITASDAVIHGLVFIRPAAGNNWTVPDTGRVVGAVVVDGNVVGGSGGSTNFGIEYDLSVVRAARMRSGSFITVPGGWRDSPRP